MRAIGIAVVVVLALPIAAPAQDAEPPRDPTVVIQGVRPTDAGPLPGLMIDESQVPGNIQSATREEIRKSGALNIGEFMNAQMQGVSISDYAGNPFQMDVNYRGFTASPQVGTPQGVSVFFDGVRVNEPFGDVVNWDLVPLNAIERFDLFPGSNPLFGLNTLGGAISVRTRSGFTSPGVEASVLAGDFGRKQVSAAVGANNRRFGGFLAANWFDEDGWRDNSPSEVGQLFARGDWRGRFGTLIASVLVADNDLIGNGLIPEALYELRPESVFTSPDQAQNELKQFSLSGAYDVSQALNITAQVYRRVSDRDGLNGDIYEGFDDFSKDDDFIVDMSRPVGDRAVARNGANQNNRVGGITEGTGVVEGTPIGLLTSMRLAQRTNGAAVQSNWNLVKHKFMVGASIDRSESAYLMSQRLGLIDPTHQVFQDASGVAPEYYAAANDVVGNDFDGTSTTRSLYFNETWSPLRNLHLTLAARYNKTKTESELLVRTSVADLHEIRTNSPILDQLVNERTRTAETYEYSSFNPQIGVNWLPTPSLNLYGNVSRGARVPSVVELGCAFDDTPVDITINPNDPRTAPRSLVGPTCNLPTTLSGDPYLPQIRSTSAEIGARGRLFRRFEWDFSAFGTKLKDDIYFVGVGDGKSYFDTIGETRRLGVELGISGRMGLFDIQLGYSYTEATFQDTFFTVSPHNSTADFDQNSQSAGNLPELGDFNTLPNANAFANNGRGTYHMIRIDQGARLPGIPEYNYNGTLSLRATRALTFGLSVIAHSGTYVRGNENNLHQPAGTDQETGLYFCFRGTGCANTGLQQAFVRRGRAFTNEGRQGGFAIFNFDATYQVSPSFSVFARVNNLLDEEYVSAGRLGVNPFSPSVNGAIGPSGWNYNSSEWRNSTYVAPGAPRGVWVGFSYQREGSRP